jgi:DNA replicative helicase MCM subunit Mcm2 (Cdc46/Mcm family)
MANADAVLLEMVKGLREDVVTIRDNHLAHIAEDIQEIKVEQTKARADIDDLMEFKAGINELVKAGINRLIAVTGAILAASLGVRHMVEE